MSGHFHYDLCKSGRWRCGWVYDDQFHVVRHAPFSSVSGTTLKGFIEDSVGMKASNALHIAIASGPRSQTAVQKLPPGMPPDIAHHFLAVCYATPPAAVYAS
jgi:hypothetical protein